jgi:hypothetical protein
MARLDNGTNDAYGSASRYGTGYGYGRYGLSFTDGGGRGDSYDDGDDYGGADGHEDVHRPDGRAYGMSYVDGAGRGDGPAYGLLSGGEGYNESAVDYWTAAIDVFAGRWPTEWRERLAVARARGAVIAYWRSDANGRPCNGGRGKPVCAGMVQRTAGPLRLCSAGTLHATLLPSAYCGKRVWIVALHGDVAHDGQKMGALRREIIGEVI